jgi:hypothetical protein
MKSALWIVVSTNLIWSENVVPPVEAYSSASMT